MLGKIYLKKLIKWELGEIIDFYNKGFIGIKH